LSADDAHRTDSRSAAERLANAWAADTVLTDLPAGERPSTIEAGYEIQAMLAEMLAEPIAGYKLGLSSSNAMRSSGLGRPVAGFMPRSRVHASNIVLPIGRAETLLIEVEVAFEIATEIRPGRRVEAIETILGRAWLAVEIVRSHFVDRGTVGLPSFVADCAGFHHLVLGSELTGYEANRSPAPYIRLLRDGECVSSRAPDGDRADPLGALSMFLAMASERDQPIAAGTIVTTGNLIRPYETRMAGRFEALVGEARVAFSLRRS
jgi:2-keto-4-pentenoate hydratase